MSFYPAKGGGNLKSFDVAIQGNVGINASGTCQAVISFPSKFIKAIQLYNLGKQDRDGNVTVSVYKFDGCLQYSNGHHVNDELIISKTVDRTTVTTSPVYLEIPISVQDKENIRITVGNGDWNYGQTAYFHVYLA